MPEHPGRGAPSGDEPERLFTGYAGRLSLLMAAGWLFIMVGRQVVPPMLPAIIDDLALSPAAAGFALTLMWAWYSLFQYPGGRFSDQLSRKTVMVASLAVLIAGFVALSGVGTYAGFLVAVSLVGVGAGLYFTPTRALLSDLFTVRRGQAFSIQVAAGRTGSVLAATVAVAALALATWRAAFLPVALLLGVVLVLVHRWGHEPYVLGRVTLGLRETGTRVFREPQMRWVLAAYTLFAFTSQAFSSFLPTFLQLERGFSAGLASFGFALLFLVGIVATLVAGRLGDRFSRERVAMVALAVGALGLIALLVVESAALLLLAVAVYAAGVWAYPPVMQAYLMDVFPRESAGGDFGAVKTIYTGIGSFGSTYVGLVAERASYAAAFGGLIACLVVGSAILLWVSRRNSAAGGHER